MEYYEESHVIEQMRADMAETLSKKMHRISVLHSIASLVVPNFHLRLTGDKY